MEQIAMSAGYTYIIVYHQLLQAYLVIQLANCP